MTIVKFCGITNYEDAKLALDLGVDALGFNFYAASPRSISLANAQSIVRRLPADIWTVGVFVNHARAEIEQIARTLGLDTLQFHGDESLEFCSDWPEWRVLKAIRLGPDATTQDSEILEFTKVVDYLLFDSFSAEQFGGTGKEVQTEQMKKIIGLTGVREKSIISGGLTPQNVAQKVKDLEPLGVDVASGIEISPGKKSIEKMSEFIEAIRG